MKAKFFGFAALLAMTILSSSCIVSTGQDSKKQANLVNEKRNVGYFNTIVMDGICDVYFTQGDKPSMRIVATAEDLKRLSVGVQGEKLYLKEKKYARDVFGSKGKKDIKVYLTSPDLIGITLNGVGDFKAETAIDTDTLRVEMKGAGDIDFPHNLVCDYLDVSLRGAGDMDYEDVKAAKASLVLYGAGDISAKIEGARFLDTDLKGCGNMDLDLKKCGKVRCSILGVGDVTLKGNARLLDKTVRGTGNIDTSNLKVSGSKR